MSKLSLGAQARGADGVTSALSLAGIAEQIHRAWADTKTAQVAAWEGYFLTGRLLREARSRFPSDKQYGQWFAEQRFAFKSEWGRRLVAVASQEPEVRQLLASALASSDDPPGVDAVLADLRVAERRGGVRLVTPGALPAGTFDVLLADPPWRYEFVETESRAVENQYPTLDVDAICDYRDSTGRHVSDIAAEQAVLFLWATSPKLAEALRVVDAWGFEYRSNLVWVKDRIGMGYWARQRHELLLVGRRGDFPAPAQSDRPDSVIEAPRGAHSAKPGVVYDLIERMYATADPPRHVEVFARSDRPGWAAFGNQLEQVA